MPVKRIKTTRKVTPEQLGDLLQNAWKEGKINSEVAKFIKVGLLPIKYLREELQWVLSRGDCGNLFLTTEQEI